MVRAVAGAAVDVLPAMVARQQKVKRGDDIRIGSRAELHDHQARRGMWYEDVQQAVTSVGDIGEEVGAVRREVEQAALRAGPDLDLAAVHPASLARYHPTS